MNSSGRSWSDRVALLVGSFGLCGFFPVAPATFASAVVAVVDLDAPGAFANTPMRAPVVLEARWPGGFQALPARLDLPPQLLHHRFRPLTHAIEQPHDLAFAEPTPMHRRQIGPDRPKR